MMSVKNLIPKLPKGYAIPEGVVLKPFRYLLEDDPEVCLSQ
jgi:hypothetical protein